MRALALMLAVCMVFGACTTSAPADDETSPGSALIAPDPAATFTVALADLPSCLDPVRCHDRVIAAELFDLILPKLLDVDDAGTYRPTSVLAAPPRISTAGLVIEYRIAADARWADGRPITSTDVWATWQYLLDEPSLPGYEHIVSVDDSDPKVAIVTFESVYAAWPDLFGGDRGYLLKADALAVGPDDPDPLADGPTFSGGPYRLQTVETDRIVLVHNPQYWDIDAAARRDARVFRRWDPSIPDRFDSAVLPPILVPPDVDAITVPLPVIRGIWFNQTDPLVATPELRMVLRRAINRADVMRAAFPEQAVVDVVTCAGWDPTIGRWCDERDLGAPGAFDLEDLATLARNGFRLVDEVLTRNGTPVAIEVAFDPADPVAEIYAATIADQLAAIGVAAVPTRVIGLADPSAQPEPLTAGLVLLSVDVGVDPSVVSLFCGVEGSTWIPELPGTCPEALAEAARAIDDVTFIGDRMERAHAVGDMVAADLLWLPIDQEVVSVFTP